VYASGPTTSRSLTSGQLTLGCGIVRTGVRQLAAEQFSRLVIGAHSATSWPAADYIAYYCANSLNLRRGTDMNESTWRDSRGRALADFVRPSVAVDTAVLSLDQRGRLVVLQVRRADDPGWALPGTFLRVGETLSDAVTRSLRDKANVRGLQPRQLHVFDALDRDKRGWVLSVAHVEVVRPDQLVSRFSKTTRLMSAQAPGRLPHDHPDILKLAVEDLRSRYQAKPDPDGLLGEEFTLRELRLAHEAVAGEELQRDAFRRAMDTHLDATGMTVTGIRGRPAELFRRCEAAE
jgi:8-oxo-dGTP diphosphatase